MKTSQKYNRWNWLVLSLAAAFMASCAADELVNNGSNPSPGLEETISSGTINFGNQTAMTIGSSSAMGMMTKAMSHQQGDAAFYDNAACELTMEDYIFTDYEPTQEANEHMISGGTSDSPAMLENISTDVNIENGATVILDNSGSEANIIPEGATVYVNGLLGVWGPAEGGGRIVVYPGATLALSASIKDVEIINFGTVAFIPMDNEKDWDFTIGENGRFLNYGELLYGSSMYELGENLSFTLNIYGTFMTNGDLALMEPYIYSTGRFYVGGNLICSQLLSASEGGQAHIIGDMEAVGTIDHEGQILLGNPLDLCVEGTLTTTDMTVSCQANIHVGCKLVVTNELKLGGGAILCANYVEALNAELGGSDVAPVNIWLPNRGVANLTNCTLANGHVRFNLYGNEPGLVQVTSFYTHGMSDLSGIFGDLFYVNYTKAYDLDNYGNEFAGLTFANASMVNVAAYGNGSSDGCKPDFTAPDPEPEPEPEPSFGGDIIIPIEGLIDEAYTLHADDFAIRINGVYQEDITVEGNTASLNGILIEDNEHLVIKVSGLDYDNILEGNDYTYECYLWVDNRKLLTDGSGAYGPLFDDVLYEEWVDPTWDLYDDDPYGCDMTWFIQNSGEVESPAGFTVRYNVYRGLQGRPDPTYPQYTDTPYLKVSIHVQRNPSAPANTNVGVYPKVD